MATTASSSSKRQRLAPEVRRAQLIEAAVKIVLEQGYLPLSLERLGHAAGASKALIYAYFPNQDDLINAVLARAFDRLAAAGLDEASRAPSLHAAARACAGIYFEQVAACGPLAHVILREQYMIGRIDAANRRFRDRIALRLARLARQELGLTAKAAIAAFNLMVAIPELAGRMAWDGDMAAARARRLVVELIESSLEGLAPVDGDPEPEDPRTP